MMTQSEKVQLFIDLESLIEINRVCQLLAEHILNSMRPPLERLQINVASCPEEPSLVHVPYVNVRNVAHV